MPPPIPSGSARQRQGSGAGPPVRFLAPLPHRGAGVVAGDAAPPLARLLASAVSLLPPTATSHEAPPSDLTPAGAPLEAAFVWADGEAGCDPRLSLDPAPGARPDTRLATALSLCQTGAGTELAPTALRLVKRLSCWQRQAGARYGAWAGLREAPSGGLAAKLYLELAQMTKANGRPLWAAFEERLAGAPPVLAGRNLRPTMLGVTPDAGLLELYYRTDPLFPGDLDTLMTRFGLAPRGQELRRLIERLTGRSVRFEIPSNDIGFSVAFRMAADGRAQAAAFTFYSNAAALLGPDARIADALLVEGAARGWDMTDYEQAFAASSTLGREGEVPLQRHGLVGMVLAPDAAPRMTATLAVPAPHAGGAHHG